MKLSFCPREYDKAYTLFSLLSTVWLGVTISLAFVCLLMMCTQIACSVLENVMAFCSTSYLTWVIGIVLGWKFKLFDRKKKCPFNHE